MSVRLADRSSTSRSGTLPETTDHTRALTAAASSVLDALALQRARVRAITMTIELGDPAAAAHQLMLDPADERLSRLEAATDRARRRFGPTAIGPGALYTAA